VFQIGLLDRFRNKKVKVTSYQMITENGHGFYAWNGRLYQSDIVRAAIRPKVRAIGKAVAKHVRQDPKGTKVNPDAYMRFLLEEPNSYMSGQQLQEKLATQLELNNNAFAYIDRDENGMPIAIYPITSTSVSALLDDQNRLYLRFTLRNGKTATLPYADIIHLRKDFNEDDIFGTSPAEALTPLMEIVNTTDQGIVKAIKNSGVIRWLLKFHQSLRPEDIKKETKRFVEDFLSTESSAGAAATDAKADAIQVEPKDYVPNDKQMDKTVQRIYSFFNTNEKIVQGNYTEDEWISYYESAIEPDIVQMSNEFTRKLFTRRERGFGNRIVFESSNLTFASMDTKLRLVEYVDRAIMSPNEVREILGRAPYEGGDEMIRRLDTRPADE
jgi:HK97 family phage portal protein